MSKKTRGTTRTRHRRPGTRPASSRPASSRPVGQLEPAEGYSAEDVTATTGAAQLASSAAISDALAQPHERAGSAARTVHARPRAKPGSLLAARAATEYVYVAQDLKRITLVGAVLFVGLILLWLAIVVLRLIPLPFY